MAERLVLRISDLWFDLAPDLGRAGELALSLFQGLEVTSVRTERHEFRRSVEPVELKGLKYVEFRGRGAHLSISRSDMQLLLLADLEAGHPGAEIPSLRQAGEHWLEHWGCGLKAGPQVLVHLLDHAYRRPIPPRWRFPSGCLVNWFQRGTTEEYFGEGCFERLCIEKLPDGAERAVGEDFLRIDWAPTLNVPDLDDRLLASDVWLGQTLRLPRHPEFYPNGDRKHPVVGLRPSSPVALYEGMTQCGYVPLVAGWTPASLEPVLACLERGRTEAGDPLRKVMAVMPNRDLARSERKALRELGIARVLYATDGGGLVNPFPPGKWKDGLDWWDRDLV